MNAPLDKGQETSNVEPDVKDKGLKTPYEAPTLTRHGALTEVTAAGFSAINNPKDQL